MLKSIVILGKKIPIKYGKNLHVDGRKVFGYYCYDKKEIWVELNQSKKSMKSTMYHEIAHAFHDRIGLAYTDLDKNVLEMLAESTANFLLDTFRL